MNGGRIVGNAGQLADAGAAASHQPDFSRTDPVRARRRAEPYPHRQPHRGRKGAGARRGDRRLYFLQEHILPRGAGK